MEEKRFNELYDRACQRCCRVFSEFLNMEEQSILKGMYIPCVTFGGYDMAERVIAGFGENITNDDFPVVCLRISPVAKKFADELTHRDFLGALMNLGIRREMLGDIVIDDNCGYAFCLEQIKNYILDNLNKVKHTAVSVDIVKDMPENICAVPGETEFTVSSCRIDVLVSAVYKLSRKEASRLFETDKVFVNSRQNKNSSYTVKDNDVISVRGFGRFVFSSVVRKTRKDRLVVSVRKY